MVTYTYSLQQYADMVTIQAGRGRAVNWNIQLLPCWQVALVCSLLNLYGGLLSELRLLNFLG